LIAFGDVGLPLWKITAHVLCVRTTERNVIEAFLLRLLGVGVAEPHDMAGILGLSDAVVSAAMSELIRNDEIRVLRSAGQSEQAVLTEKGKAAVQEQVEHRPKEEELGFYVDGLTGHLVVPPESEVYTPRQASSAGLGVIRHFPLRPPEPLEIPVSEFGVLGDGGPRPEPGTLRVLRVKSVDRSERRYRASTSVAYKSEHGNIAQVAFMLDGRMSEEHESAFSRVRGREKIEQFASLLKPPEPVRLSEVCGEDKPELDVVVESGAARGVVAERTPAAGWTGGIVEVYQHPKLLKDAIDGATMRLVIVSPWIRAAVVNAEFLDGIERALTRGAEVWIGYGLGDDKDASPSDRAALRRLEELAEKDSRMVCRRFGDTHSKVLIKDNDWYVITSFNWLSYKGDPRRAFREELGQLMHGREQVAALWTKLSRRFARREPASQ
jgi:hypothetical protein